MNLISKSTNFKSVKFQLIAVLAVLSFKTIAWSADAATAGESVAQINPQMKVIPSLGYTYFNIQGSKDDYKSKSGNSAAVLVQMPLSDYGINFESGLEYLETGAKLTYDFGILSLDVASLKMAQLAIPLRASYTLNPSSTGTQYYVKGGMTPTYLVQAKLEDNINGVSTDVKSEMNDLGLLAQIGFGADWGHEVLNGRVHLDLSYNYGLTKIFKSTDGKSAGFHLQAGYAIAL